MEVYALVDSTLKSVLITGAANGIGKASVEHYLTTTDFTVIGIDLNEQALTTLKESLLEELRNRLVTISLDLTNEEDCSRCYEQIKSQYQSIDHIVICHGVGYDNDITDNTKWDRILATNLHSTQRLLSFFIDSVTDGGRIVIISSILGRVGQVNNTGYVASKHALLGLTKALALDVARQKITVNAVLPAWVETPMLLEELNKQALQLGVPTQKLIRKAKKQIPLRQLVSPEDVAATIAFLVSPAASMITAQSIIVDGGFTCGV
jgi:3-hydroxybutyrate dehydrogenase/3-oxoacyl-[acyl-carrier protein] reductase